MSVRLIQLFITFCLVFPCCRTDSLENPTDWSRAALYSNQADKASVLMEIHQQLDPEPNGEYGMPGVCSRVFRILRQTQVSPVEECNRLGNSRQSGLGDIAQFYQALTKNSSFKETLDFPLSDKFPRFSFRASFVHVPMHRNEPAVMIETGSQGSHVVCVQSVPCPTQHPTTTTTVTTKTSEPTQPVLPVVLKHAQLQAADESPGAHNPPAALSRNEAFWEALLSGTEAKTWFIATVCLSIVAFLLLVILLITWLYIFRIRRLYKRRRCRGTCRSGCRCSADTVRKSLTDAAVCGPFEPAPKPYAPGNGSLHNGMMPLSSGGGCTPYGGSFVYHGGTMTSSRWCGSPTQKAAVSTPLCGSITNGGGGGGVGEKTGMLSHQHQGYLLQNAPGMCHSKASETEHQWTFSADNAGMPSRSMSQVHRGHPSHEAVCHANNNASDGSSISGHGQTMQQQQQPRFAPYLSTSNPHEYAESETTTPLPTASIHLMGRAGGDSPYGRLPETGPPAVDEQTQRSRLLVMPSGLTKHSLTPSLGYTNTSQGYNKAFPGEFLQMSSTNQSGGLEETATGTQSSSVFYSGCRGSLPNGDSFNMTSTDRHVGNGYGVDTNSFKGAINSHYAEKRSAPPIRDANSLLSGEVQVTDIAPPSGFYDQGTGDGVGPTEDCSMTVNSGLVIRNAGGKTSPPAAGSGQFMVNGSGKMGDTGFRSQAGDNCNTLYRPVLLIDSASKPGEAGWNVDDREMVGVVDSAAGQGRAEFGGRAHGQPLHLSHNLDISRNLLPSRLYGASERML